MNERKKMAADLIRKIPAKWLLIAGIIGIFLIAGSSMFSTSDKNQPEKSVAKSIEPSEYGAELEKKIRAIVSSITGEKNPTVVVTLETGIQYLYAGDETTKTASSTENTSGTIRDEAQREQQADHVILKASDGGERAVIVTEYMPAVRGVAVVCSGGNSEPIRREIIGAVTAALDIGERKIYVTGTN